MGLKKICASALALAITATVLPAQAAPFLRIDQGKAASSDIVQIQDRRCPPQGCRPGDRPGAGRPDRPGNNQGAQRPGRPGGSNAHRPGRPGHWNGHQGYRDPRPGYRRGNDGWWYPMAAFGVGALIGGAIANQPREVAPPHLSTNHLRWCENQYRSYRASDNTFQPYEGSRRQCVSPYN
jgi:hypothetical protein